MHKLRKDKAAVSEVIGALMLTLIVVVAASSFAVYVAEKQKVEQDNQELQDQRKQESISVISITPSFNATKDHWDGFNFTLNSNHVGDSNINKILINDHVLRNFTLVRYDKNTCAKQPDVEMDYTQIVNLGPRENVELKVNNSCFFDSPLNISIKMSITLSLHTELNNIFQKSFQPPNSLISITTYSWFNNSKGSYDQFMVLDGSNSQQVGGGFIVTWKWEVTNETGYSNDLFGQKARWDDPNSSVATPFIVSLTVTNNYGMIGYSNTTYIV
jgi:FlaG/FlaF family flagellin (archaellin)